MSADLSTSHKTMNVVRVTEKALKIIKIFLFCRLDSAGNMQLGSGKFQENF
jgi:hypothetical protein